MESSNQEHIEITKETSLYKDFIIDFCAGTVAGITSTLVGHPLDTIKVYF